MEIETLLNEEIKSELESMKDDAFSAEENKDLVDGVVKLIDRAIEIEKLKAEKEEKEFERNLKLEQAKKDERDRWIKNGITVAGIIIPVIVTIWGTKKSFEFEKEGTITTIMGRGFINKLLPKK